MSRDTPAGAVILALIFAVMCGLALGDLLRQGRAPAPPVARAVVLDGWFRGHGGPCALPVRVEGRVHVIEASSRLCAVVAPGDVVDVQSTGQGWTIP